MSACLHSGWPPGTGAFLIAQRRPVANFDFERVDQTMGALGDVDHCRARLQKIVSELRPGRVITWFDFGGRVPHAEVLESMKLF